MMKRKSRTERNTIAATVFYWQVPQVFVVLRCHDLKRRQAIQGISKVESRVKGPGTRSG